jgi:thiol-disulfide isomerase/thioredoxin
VGLLAGCSSVSGTGGKGYITADGTVTEVDPADRGKPVELSGDDLDGDALSLEELRGKPVVVNVWWSRCPPCRAEQPELNEVAAELGDRVAFLGINIRDLSADDGLAYVRAYDVPYPSVYAPDGRALLPFAGTLAPNSVPATVVLDEQGRIAASILGRIPSPTTLSDVVEKVLDE